MSADANCRAMQHMLLQGFTLYTAQAAVCTRVLAPSLLEDPEHAWAAIFDVQAQVWMQHIPENDRYLLVFAEAALKATNGGHHVVCHTQGETLVLPMEVSDVRAARMRIEAAVVMKTAPPVERLTAYPDELIEQEAKRRRAKKRPEEQDPPPD